MAGYNGYSMSNNAVAAYQDGEKPLSKWTKKEILNRIANQIEQEELELHCSLALLKKLSLKALKGKLPVLLLVAPHKQLFQRNQFLRFGRGKNRRIDR